MPDKTRKELTDLIKSQYHQPEVDPTEIEAIYEEIPLTYKEKIVVEEMCRHGNMTKAGMAIGIKESSASAAVSHYMNKANVQLAIIRRQQAIAKASLVTKEWITTELLDMYETVRGRKVPNEDLVLRILQTIAKVNGLDGGLNLEALNNVDSIEIKITKGNQTIDTKYEDIE
jgi:hypothetical protein